MSNNTHCPFCYRQPEQPPVHICTGLRAEIPVCKACKSLILCDTGCRAHCKCIHVCIQPYICRCGLVFNDQFGVTPYSIPAQTRFHLHAQTHDYSQLPMYTCPYCNLPFNDTKSYTTHVSGVHISRREILTQFD